MRWCRIRFVLLGLLLCVVHVVSGTCGQRFTDPASSALLADIVIEGKVRKTANPGSEQVFNITVAIRKSILKGANLINHGLAAKKITVGRFKNGGRDLKNCVGSVQEGRTYYFFLKDIAHPKGLHFEIATMPVNKSTKVASELRRILCDRCAQAPVISRLTGSDRVMPGTRATLTCGAESKPNPEFSWYKDGVLLPANRKGRVRIKSRKRMSTLQIKNVTEAEGGVYQCVAVNAVGEARKDFTVRVVTSTGSGVAHAVQCVVQTLCLNGGTCLMMIESPFCMCPEQWAGRRCELLDAMNVRDDYNQQATLLYERTLIIIGIVIAVLVFIIISIASYVLAEHGRKHFKDRQRLRQAQRSREHGQPALLVDRNSTQPRTSKEPENRSENLPSDLTPKQRMFILQESPKFSDQKVANRDFNELPRQQLSDTKMDPNGQQQHESRQRLPAFSVYENVGDPNPRSANNDEGLKYNSASATVHPEMIEMSVLPESRLQSDVIDKSNASCTPASINNNGHDDSVDRPALLHVHSSDPLSANRQAANNCNQITETSPLLAELNSAPSERLAPSYSLPLSSSQPVITRHRFHDDASSKDDIRTAGQPLLQNHTSSPIENGGQFAPPSESKSDRNLSRHALPDNSQQACPNNHGSAAPSLDNNRLNKLPHSNTFPKSKVNGPTLDVCSESDDEDDVEIPYEKQLHISEEDLLLSQETFGDSSYLIRTTPTKQNAHEELVIGLLPNSVIRRPGMRKYQSEEGPTYSKLNSKNAAFLQLNVRSRSLDDPLGTEDDNPDPMRLNSTMAGSPDVETYDNMAQQHAHLHNNMYSYDPNDDSTPWDKDINKTDSTNFSKEDKINGLKDVLPDQQPIPI